MYRTKGNEFRMGVMAIVLALGSSVYAEPTAAVTAVVDGVTFLVVPGDVVDLGDVDAGVPTNFLFQVRNQGDGTLALDPITATAVSDNVQINSAGFTQILDTFACGVSFAAESPGAGEFDVEIESNDPNSPFSFTVQFEARAPQLVLTQGLVLLSVDDALEMDAVEVGQVGGDVIVARNTGNETLNFLGAAQVTDLTGGEESDITITLPNAIAADGFGVIQIAFEPTTVGDRKFLVQIQSNAAQSQYEFAIVTVGLEPQIEIEDCNQNGIDDAEDLAAGTHSDCDLDGLLDECETDADGDGVVDDCDECPGEDDLLDTDGDTIADCLDNCPDDANFDQVDSDDNGVGDACDEQEQLIADCNGNDIDDATDLAEGAEEDCNQNGIPDSCEHDADGDGVIDGCDRCPGEDDLPDGDNDGVADCLDNCLGVANFDQADDDGNGVGDACEEEDEPVGAVEPVDPAEPVNPVEPTNPIDPEDGDTTDDRDDNGAPFCGAGVSAMIPMMLCGLCGMRSTRRRHPRAVAG